MFFSLPPLGIVLKSNLHVMVLVSDPTSSEIFYKYLFIPLHSFSDDDMYISQV